MQCQFTPNRVIQLTVDLSRTVAEHMATGQRRKALVADDHGLYRKSLGLLLKDSLDFADVIEVSGFDDAMDRLAGDPSISLALFDLSMPGMNGPQSLTVVKETYPHVRVAVVSGSEDRNNVLSAVSLGLSCYIPKSLPEDEIVKALTLICDGQIYIPRFMMASAAPPMPEAAAPVTTAASAIPVSEPTLENLTPRQRDVLQCILRGLANKEIARELDIAEGTVKIHLAALFAQFAARNRTELATRAQALAH